MLTFSINDEQMQKLQNWRKNHTCIYRTPGGRYDMSYHLSTVGCLEEFRFIPTSVGVVVTTCMCACGEEIDLTDHSDF